MHSKYSIEQIREFVYGLLDEEVSRQIQKDLESDELLKDLIEGTKLLAKMKGFNSIEDHEKYWQDTLEDNLQKVNDKARDQKIIDFFDDIIDELEVDSEIMVQLSIVIQGIITDQNNEFIKTNYQATLVNATRGKFLKDPIFQTGRLILYKEQFKEKLIRSMNEFELSEFTLIMKNNDSVQINKLNIEESFKGINYEEIHSIFIQNEAGNRRFR